VAAHDLAPVLKPARHRQYVLLVLHVAQEDLVDALEDRVVVAVGPVDAVPEYVVVEPVLVRVAVPIARGFLVALLVGLDPRQSPGWRRKTPYHNPYHNPLSYSIGYYRLLSAITGPRPYIIARIIVGGMKSGAVIERETRGSGMSRCWGAKNFFLNARSSFK
jgi:hypothetical protein